MVIISSKDNDIIKHIKKLSEKKYREEFGEYVIEGKKIVEEAIENGADIERIVVSESFIRVNNMKDVTIVTDKVFESMSGLVNSEGVLAVIRNKKLDEENIDLSEDFYLILNDIQDPGNLGTIIRTADSLNIKQILVTDKTVDAYNPKVVRSTMGAIFRVKIITINDIKKTIEKLKENGIKVYTTDLNTENTIYNISFDKAAVVIGNEANGVSEEVKNMCDSRFIIPMLGKTESLNAAVATGVVLYEAFRNKLMNK